MPLAMAAFSVGQSAVGSVADTISTFAPLAIAAWIAGIWDVGVAAVPLVSVPVSPSLDSAASAPPDFTLSAVVKYGLPRFLGMTNTFKPVLRPPLPPAPGEDDDELPDEQAASMPTASMSAAGPSSTWLALSVVLAPSVVLALTVESFQSSV